MLIVDFQKFRKITRQTEDLLLSIGEKGNHFVLMSVKKDGTSGREQLFLEESFKDFENKKNMRLMSMKCLGSVVRGSFTIAAPILRGLSSLMGNVKHLGKYKGYVEA